MRISGQPCCFAGRYFTRLYHSRHFAARSPSWHCWIEQEFFITAYVLWTVSVFRIK